MFLRDVIKKIKPRQIISSRATPTVEVEFLLNGTSLYSSFPTGKSTGSLEADVVVDSDECYNSECVTSNRLATVKCVVDSIKKHSELILNLELVHPDMFDAFLIALDHSKNKSNLGANFILPLSICYRKLHAYLREEPVWKQFTRIERFGANRCVKNKCTVCRGGKKICDNANTASYIANNTATCSVTNTNTSIPLENFISPNPHHVTIPLVHFNLLNGGLHSGNNLACQEVMLCFNRPTFKEQLNCSLFFFRALGAKISSLYGRIALSVGDEGGYAPPVQCLDEALTLITSTARENNVLDFKIALDMAANSFYVDGKYHIDGMIHNGVGLSEYYEHLIGKFPIYSIEDPFAEQDYESWRYFYKRVNDRINIVSDDLTVTNVELIEKYGNMQMFNTVLIKPSQVGSVLEACNSIKLCNEMGLKVMCSHRSGETEDTFISDFAVGMGAQYLKAGAPCRGERTCKYNELLRIEERILEEGDSK